MWVALSHNGLTPDMGPGQSLLVWLFVFSRGSLKINLDPFTKSGLTGLPGTKLKVGPSPEALSLPGLVP